LMRLTVWKVCCVISEACRSECLIRVDFVPAGAFGEMVVTHGRLSLMSAHIG